MASKILIVDDEIHLAKILQFTLQHAGYSTLLAHDGREAMDLIEEERPDLVMLDLMLPVIDGYKVCNQIKQDDRLKNIPVIILSARDLEREKPDEPITADLFIEKPFNTEDLLNDISELLEKSERS